MRLAWLVVAGALAAQPAQVSPEQAMRFHSKLLGILQASEHGAPGGHRTTISEGELNSYLRYGMAPGLPAGVTEPAVGFVGSGRVKGRAIVDLDAVRTAKSTGGWLDPMAYLSGKLPITAEGILTADKGQARFALERAEVNGVPMPKTFLQQVVSYYTRTPEQPGGVNLDEPFALPADIQRIEIQAGQALVTQ